MIANVQFKDHGFFVNVHPLALHADEFYEAVGEEARKLGLEIVLGNVEHPEAIAATGRALARTLIESSDVDRTPEEWGVWFAAQPDEFYQLWAVVENHDLWEEWSDGDS